MRVFSVFVLAALLCGACNRKPELIEALSLGVVCDTKAVDSLWLRVTPDEQMVRLALTKQCLAQVMLEDLRFAHGRLVASVGRKLLAEAIAAKTLHESSLNTIFMIYGFTLMACDDLKSIESGKMPQTIRKSQQVVKNDLEALCDLREVTEAALHGTVP